MIPVKCSLIRGSVGRIVHVYSDQWAGPRPGIVVGGPFEESRPFTDGFGQFVNVNVFLDGANDPSALAACRAATCGNTLCSVPLFDELKQEDRVELMAVAPDQFGSNANGIRRAWAEWPPRV
jgi:hypothetical protein